MQTTIQRYSGKQLHWRNVEILSLILIKLQAFSQHLYCKRSLPRYICDVIQLSVFQLSENSCFWTKHFFHFFLCLYLSIIKQLQRRKCFYICVQMTQNLRLSTILLQMSNEKGPYHSLNSFRNRPPSLFFVNSQKDIHVSICYKVYIFYLKQGRQHYFFFQETFEILRMAAFHETCYICFCEEPIFSHYMPVSHFYTS